jgi:hypothetical protein
MMIETKLGCCLNGLFLIACGRFSVFFFSQGWGGGDFPFQEKKKKKNLKKMISKEKNDFCQKNCTNS